MTGNRGRKLIALDLDGTLLNSQKTINPRTKQVLAALQAAGHHLVIATGRSTRGSMRYYDELGLDTPMVNFNGAFVHNVRDAAWGEYHFPLDREVALRVVEICERFQIGNILAEIRDEYYLRQYDPDLIRFIGDGHEPLAIGPIHEVLPSHPTSLLIRPDHDTRMQELRDHLHNDHAGIVEHRLWGAPWNVIEIVKIGVNKATGLQIIADKLGLGREDVIAFGDEDNDFEMIEWAGLGVAMANGNPKLQALADHVTASNDDDGIALVLENLL